MLDERKNNLLAKSNMLGSWNSSLRKHHPNREMVGVVVMEKSYSRKIQIFVPYGDPGSPWEHARTRGTSLPTLAREVGFHKLLRTLVT